MTLYKQAPFLYDTTKHASGFLPFSFLGFVNSKNPQKPSKIQKKKKNLKTLETQKLEAFSMETPPRVLMQNSRNSSKLTLVYYSM
jgi:hypothetical protein